MCIMYLQHARTTKGWIKYPVWWNKLNIQLTFSYMRGSLNFQILVFFIISAAERKKRLVHHIHFLRFSALSLSDLRWQGQAYD